MSYVELNAATHFSFLRGVSSAEEIFAAAASLGYSALGITDRNTVGGLVRSLVAAEKVGIRLVAGCRLDLVDGVSLLAWPRDRAGWSSLTRLLTIGKGRADRRKGEKGRCFLYWEDVEACSHGLVAALIPDQADRAAEAALAATTDIFGARAHLALSLRRRPGDAMRLHALDAMARRFGLRSLAVGDVLYDGPDKRLLQDVVTAIRNKCTIDDLGFRRETFADRHLKAPAEMARRFRDFTDAVRASADIAESCTFSLRELSYQYPDEIVMSGRSPQDALERLTRSKIESEIPPGVPPEPYHALLEKELKLVASWGYAPYFLTVNSIVTYARSQEILCQGRGSAANSMICFVLGITSIDPVKHGLLFERFLSENRKEPPDIDVDFEHERREEVIQWIYETYGLGHAALTAVVSRYRSRGALREVGKALGLSEDMTGALSGQIWGWSNDGVDKKHVAQLGMDLSNPRLALTLRLAKQLIGTPRHLSQHPGGFVLTRDRLDDLVPIEPAAMVNRQVIEWEKNDIEELRFMKVDVLGLGMLSCMRRAFEFLKDRKGVAMGLDSPILQEDDSRVYEMIQRADTIGVFQIESRAQMSMLPRLKPKDFYDIVIQVAIVRPGPIQGDMVHPYLRRREGKEVVEYPSEALRTVLKKTLGVPLFQEQAMNVAIVGAGFTPAEADALRRSMATFKHTGGVSKFREPMIAGMIGNGYTAEFAERTFKQIEGFGSYGFPESHAASFAKIAYASSWMKCHHPDIFCAALLNAQPMGFYQPAQIVRDAQQHGVEVRPICINESRWDCTLENPPPDFRGRGTARNEQVAMSPGHGCADWQVAASPRTRLRAAGQPAPANGTAHLLMVEGPAESAMPLHHASHGPPPLEIEGRIENAGEDLSPLRLGMRMVKGLSNIHGARIIAARGEVPFASIEEAWLRSGVPSAALEKLADADAFAGFGLSRREALWQVRGLGQAALPLFAAADTRSMEPAVTLAPMTEGREVVEDYAAVQLSLRAHPLAFLRAELDRRRIIRCGDLVRMKDGARVEVSGIVLIRQKPGKGNVTFITLEDESGIANAILWQRVFDAHRRIVMGAPMIAVKGLLQREGAVIHIIADRIEDQGDLLGSVGRRDFPHRFAPADGATAGGGYDRREPLRLKSRNFH
jgi:error-prone DNA polymerase